MCSGYLDPLSIPKTATSGYIFNKIAIFQIYFKFLNLDAAPYDVIY